MWIRDMINHSSALRHGKSRYSAARSQAGLGDKRQDGLDGRIIVMKACLGCEPSILDDLAC